MTEQTQPTDAELLDAADDFRSQYKHGGTTFDEFDALGFARAVLAKWGQPAQAAEPVAWLRNTTDPQPHAVTNLKYRSAADAEVGIEYIPVYTAPQPVAREPISNFHAADEFTAEPHTDDVFAAYQQGIRLAERHHGIKGGQHGTDT